MYVSIWQRGWKRAKPVQLNLYHILIGRMTDFFTLVVVVSRLKRKDLHVFVRRTSRRILVFKKVLFTGHEKTAIKS